MLRSENNDPAAITQFSWIPQAILHMAAVGIDVKSGSPPFVTCTV